MGLAGQRYIGRRVFPLRGLGFIRLTRSRFGLSFFYLFIGCRGFMIGLRPDFRPLG